MLGLGGRTIRIALTLLVAALFMAPGASAQTTSPSVLFEHDDSLDGDPNTEIIGGFFGLLPGSGTPDEQRRALYEFLEANDDDDDFDVPDPSRNFAWETFEFAVKDKVGGDTPDDPADDAPIVNGSFTVHVGWGNPDVDFDVFVYRRLADGSLSEDPIASSAAGGTTEENATYTPGYTPSNPQPPVESDCEETPETDDGDTRQCRYVAYVDNWCSNETDPLDVELAEDVIGQQLCEQGGYVDEDDWTGEVSFAPLVLDNVAPTAELSGPAEGKTGDALTFTGSGTDSDGTIERYAFDLDGDGLFEYDNGTNAVEKVYTEPGNYAIGLRVTDDRGGVAYDSLALTITGSSAPAGTSPTPTGSKPRPALLASFKLGRPVFGGRKNAKLVARYRVRARRPRHGLALPRQPSRQADRRQPAREPLVPRAVRRQEAAARELHGAHHGGRRQRRPAVRAPVRQEALEQGAPALRRALFCPLAFRHGRHRIRPAQARPRVAPQALHLQRRPRPAARVDPRVRGQGARAARGGVGGDDVPRLGVPRAWASSASSGSPTPRSTAARAATTSPTSCSPRRWCTPSRGGLAMGIAVHTDMATPPVFLFGTEEQKQRYLVPVDQGREDLLPGHHRARRRLRRVGHQDPRRARRRRVGHQRLEDLHHQRPPGRLHRAGHQDRPRRRLRRLHALPRRHGPARRDPREEAARSSACTPPTPRCSPSRTCACRRTPCSARRARASTTSCGSSRASA